MADEGFGNEWDADFIEALVKAEEFALSFPTRNHRPPPPPPPQPQPQPHAAVPEFSKGFNQSSSDVDIFSTAAAAIRVALPAPRGDKEHEIENLKEKLDRVTIA